MSLYMFRVKATAEAVKGVMAEGVAARAANASQVVESLGGKLGGYYVVEGSGATAVLSTRAKLFIYRSTREAPSNGAKFSKRDDKLILVRHLLAEFEETESAAALAVAVTASGVGTINYERLLNPEEAQAAINKVPAYRPPGG